MYIYICIYIYIYICNFYTYTYIYIYIYNSVTNILEPWVPSQDKTFRSIDRDKFVARSWLATYYSSSLLSWGQRSWLAGG